MTKKTFAAAFLSFALTVPALAAPLVLRPEVPVSPPEYGLAGEIGRSDARIVTNGHDYLAVWTDLREGDVPSVYAARLQPDGTVLDPFGVRIATGAYAGPVVWTGTRYLIAYEDAANLESYVITLAPDGVLGQPFGVGHSARWGSMATNGTNVLLVLPSEAMLLDLEGHRLRDVYLADLGTQYFHTRVDAAGSTYLVAAAVPDVVVQTVSSDGTVGPPLTLAKPTTHTLIGLASDGERFLIVWPHELQLHGQLITKSGQTGGPVHTIAPNIAGYPSVEWRDGEYLVLFSERTLYSHYAVRVAADGSPIGTPKRLQQDYNAETQIAAHGRGGIALFGRLQAAVFDDASLASDEVFRRYVDVAVTARPQRRVRLARLGNGYVAAWAEGGRTMLSAGPGRPPVAVEGSTVSLIDVVVDRSNIVWVMWVAHTANRVGLSRFWADLTPVDPAPIYFEAPGMSHIAGVAAGAGVIAFVYEVGDVFGRDVASMLLTETGHGIARKDIRLTAEEFADFRPTVTFDGSAFVYGWSHAKGEFPEMAHLPHPEIELVGARVSPSGTLLDASPVRIAQDVGLVTEIEAAPGANGVAFAWRAEDRPMRAALFGGRTVDLGAPQMALAELEPHNGGFLLVRGVARVAPALTEAEYLVLGADLSVTATGALPPYQGNSRSVPFDIDVIGGDSPVFAYSRMAADPLHGGVSRVFIRRTGEGPTRRRAVRFLQ